MTKTRPTREGKGGIQDGILLEKAADTPKLNTPLRWAARRPGGVFWIDFGHHFGPVGSRLVPCGSLLVHFFPPMSRKPADFSLPISLLQVAGVPGVRRCRSASTMHFGIIFHTFCITFLGIDFASILYRLFMHF